MKDKAAAGLVLAPPMPEDEDEEAPESSGEPSTKVDTLLGNAFDAYSEGDKPGFIASMKAAMRAR